MKDSDFDKIFAGKFSRLTGAPYREENWAELSHQLDAHGRWRRWMLPVLIPLLALLAAGNIFWWFQWREVALHNKSSDNQTLILQSDTIVRTTTVYRFDTIYQTVTHVISSRLQRPGLASPVSENPVPFPANDRNAGDLSVRQPPATDAGAITGASTGPAGPKDAVDQSVNADANQRSVGPLAGGREKSPGIADTTSNFPLRTTPETGSEVIDKDTIFQLSIPTPGPVKKAGSPAFYIARPRLGLLAGWGSPPFSGALSGSILKFGLAADVEVARHFRLGMNVSFDRAWIKSEDTKTLAVDVDIPDPGQDFKLEYWKAKGLQTVSYSMNLHYTYPTGKTWSPRIGIGAQAATFFPFDVEFEFENNDNDIEIDIPAQTGTITRWQGMLMTLGLDIQLSRRMTLGLESYLLRRFDKKETLIDNQIGFKTNLFYHF